MSRILVPDKRIVPYSSVFNATTSTLNFGAITPRFDDNQAQTWLVYARRDGTGEGNFGYYFGKTTTSTTGGIRLFDDATNGRTTFGVRNTAPTDAPQRSIDVQMTAGKWAHLAVTYTGGLLSSAISMFYGIDGEFLKEGNYVNPLDGSGAIDAGTAKNFHIGNRDGTDRTFNGLIGYVARWNRVLSLAELRHAQNFGPLAVPNGLVFCWSGNRDWGPFGYRATPTAISIGALPPNSLLSYPTGRFIPFSFSSTVTSTLTGSVQETGSDTATGSLSFIHTVTGAVTETGTDTATGSLSFIHEISGAVQETGADTASGTIQAGLDHYLSGAVQETGSDTATGSLTYEHYLSGSAVEVGTDTVTGSLLVVGVTEIYGNVIEGRDTATGYFDNPEAITTKGGAGKAKVKKKRKQSQVEVDPRITELIQNLETEKTVKGVKVHETVQKTVKLYDLASLKADLDYLLTKKEAKKPEVTEKLPAVEEKAPKEPIFDPKAAISELRADFEAKVKELEEQISGLKKANDDLEELIIALTT